MITFLQSVNVFATAGLLLVIAAGLAGKYPTRPVFLAGAAVSGLLIAAGLLRGDLFTVWWQTVALGAWVVTYGARQIHAARKTHE